MNDIKLPTSHSSINTCPYVVSIKPLHRISHDLKNEKKKKQKILQN